MALDITKGGFTTLADFAAANNTEKKYRVLCDTIRDYSAFFDQAVIQAGNDGTGDRGQVITSYPEGEAVAYNEGWDAEKSAGVRVRYDSARIASRSTVDKALYDSRDPRERDAWRLQQDLAFSRGLTRGVLRRVLYGNRAQDPRDINGLLNIVTPTNDAFKYRLIDAKGTSDGKLTDILLVNWDAKDCFLFYPQFGANLGLKVEDTGEHYETGTNGKKMRALFTEFEWQLGIAVYNPERVVRIANVDVSKLTKKNTQGPDLLDLMIQALERLPDEQEGRVSFYMNDNTRSFLARQILNKDNVLLSLDEVAGRKVLSFRGVPIQRLGTDVMPNNGKIITGIPSEI